MPGFFRLSFSAGKPNRPIFSRTTVMLAGAALAVSAAIVSTGCDSGSTFLPPPPDGLRGAASDNVDVPAPPALEGSSSGARSVDLILDRRDSAEVEATLAAARTQAGLEKVKIRPQVMTESGSPARQLELVREAITRHPLALIVELADPSDPGMAQAIQKARAEGIPVVLLNKPLAPSAKDADAAKATSPAAKGSPAATTTAESAGSARLVVVAPPPFTDPARQLVASAIRNARNAGLDLKGGALIVVNKITDAFTQERITAIRNALKDNGVTQIEELTISKSVEAGAKLLKEKLTSNPKLVLVFEIDGLSTSAARQVMADLIPERLYVQAAFPADGTYTDMIRIGDFAAVAAFVPNRLMRKAITTAVSLSQGRDVPAKIEVPIEFHDSDEKATTPQSPVYYKAKSAAKKAP